MKKKILAVLLTALMLASCGQKAVPSSSVSVSSAPLSQEQLDIQAALAKWENTQESSRETALLDQKVSLTSQDFSLFLQALEGPVSYPYEEYFQLSQAYERYLALGDWKRPGENQVLTEEPLTADRLYELVKGNNQTHRETNNIITSGYYYSDLEEEYLQWACQVICDTVNGELERWDFGPRLACIDQNLADLAIFKNDMGFQNATYTNEGVMTLQPAFIESMIAISDNDLASHLTVTHEVEHLLQKLPNQGYEALGVDRSYGFCYWWDDLPVNSLYNSWFAEASAERLAALFYDTQPTTYAAMLGYLDSLCQMALPLDIQPEEIPRLSQQPHLETVFSLFGRETPQEQLEFLKLLYAIEIIQQEPADFWEHYTSLTGREKSEAENVAIKRQVKAAACLTMSRIYYENLARRLAQEELTLRELFYLVSVWEFDLNMHLIYEDETRIEDNAPFFTGYLAMQEPFWQLVASKAGCSQEELEELYTASHCRLRIPKRSLLYGDEIWDGLEIAGLSQEANDFLDSYYQNTSASKTVTVAQAAEILQKP